ncbi:MAG: 3D domain-containing protein [Desulfitobacteriaceae bacterium]
MVSVNTNDQMNKTDKPISYGTTVHEERRIMKVTAYTAHDVGMDGRGITASGNRVQEGVTIAAPNDIPLGAQILIPALGQTYVVTDRGGAIKGNRLDLYIEDRKKALEFGVKELEVFIKNVQ